MENDGQSREGPRVKGVAMLNVVRALRSLGKERARELLPAHLHKYLGDERVLPVAWYPETDILELNRALAQIVRPTLPGATLEDTFVHMGKLLARTDLSGVYAALNRAREPSQVAARLTALWKRYHDTGWFEIALENNHGRFELHDFAAPSRELCWIQRGWYLAYFELTGASQANVIETQCFNRGAPSCVWEATWT